MLVTRGVCRSIPFEALQSSEARARIQYFVSLMHMLASDPVSLLFHYLDVGLHNLEILIMLLISYP